MRINDYLANYRAALLEDLQEVGNELLHSYHLLEDLGVAELLED